MAYTTYPNIARGLKAGLIGGGLVGLLWFLVRCWAASLSAPTPVSLSLAFRPWQQNWPGALVVFAAGFLVIGALAALRPAAGRETPGATPAERGRPCPCTDHTFFGTITLTRAKRN
ncbi:MAG: hypothetical protein ABIF82_11530 [Planctomycetota bacterium]